MNQTSLLDFVQADGASTLGKAFLEGTHRASRPERLLASLSTVFHHFKISRVARITGLDRIGVEVYSIVRPNSSGLSVTQGKGLRKLTAKLSGIMEAVECLHAEHPENALFLASSSELTRRWPDVSTEFWSAKVDPARRILWTAATNLLNGAEVPVPFDLVHANFDAGERGYSSGLLVSTNGLASGGNLAEAVVHALCEVIERHATLLFGTLPTATRDERVLDLTSIDDPICLSLIDRCAGAKIGLKVWDTTCEIAVPSFIACVSDRKDPQMPPGFGAGCHPARAVALCRAITEAAQSRLTRISGARDDLASKYYGHLEHARSQFLLEQDGVRSFAETPDCVSDCLVEDFRRVRSRIRAAGHHDVFAVLLANNAHYCVVRAIVPGLHGLEDEM